MNKKLTESNLKIKGISSVAAAVIIATISISLVGTTYFFSRSLTETAMAETFEIVDIFQNRIIVRNTGTQPISKFKTLIDGIEVKNEIKDPPIQPQSVGTVNLNIENISPGRHQLTLISRSMSQTWMWEFEIITTTVVTTTLETTTTPTTTLPTTTIPTEAMTGVMGIEAAVEREELDKTRKYTQSTETYCSNGKCTMTLYSGIKFVEEDLF